METKPWNYTKIDSSKGFPEFIISSEAMPGILATVYNTEANARLIASAPELLEACNKALIHLEVLGIETGLQEDLKQIISKAD